MNSNDALKLRSVGEQHVVVIGGGIIGAMCAWFLLRAGYRVTIVDRKNFGAACSHGNCGYVCPSHVLPLPRPGVVAKTFKGLFDRHSALSIKPRCSLALWSWLWNFTRRCNQNDMLRTAKARHALLQSSMELYKDFVNSQQIECEWEERGLLFVFQSQKEFERYAITDRLLQSEFGIEAKPYTGKGLIELEPALMDGLGGAWHYRGDCHLRADKLMSQLRTKLEQENCEIIESFPIENFKNESDRAVSISNVQQQIDADIFVVATGAMTPFLNKQLGCKIPIEPGKGYSITMPHPELCPKIPMILEEYHVGVTPMKSCYRLGSTMEFAGFDTRINPKRIELLKFAAKQYLHKPYRDPVEEEWYGWRPMTWDGKPIIDRSPKFKNVWIAAGHNMLGLSMATGTGKLIQELIAGDEPHIDPVPFNVSRF